MRGAHVEQRMGMRRGHVPHAHRYAHARARARAHVHTMMMHTMMMHSMVHSMVRTRSPPRSPASRAAERGSTEAITAPCTLPEGVPSANCSPSRPSASLRSGRLELTPLTVRRSTGLPSAPSSVACAAPRWLNWRGRPRAAVSTSSSVGSGYSVVSSLASSQVSG